MEFKQRAFLKPYIEHNTILRKQAEKEDIKIKVQNAKLRNVAILGKSTENPAKKSDVKTVTSRIDCWKRSFGRGKHFDNGLTMIQKYKCSIKLNKPTHIGTSILELSKD